jgi:hypothetical protein
MAMLLGPGWSQKLQGKVASDLLTGVVCGSDGPRVACHVINV